MSLVGFVVLFPQLVKTDAARVSRSKDQVTCKKAGGSCVPPAVKVISVTGRCLCSPPPPLASFSPSLLSLRQDWSSRPAASAGNQGRFGVPCRSPAERTQIARIGT